MSDREQPAAIEVRDDPESEAYVVEVDGAHAGKAEYRTMDGRRVFTHTEVDDEYSGQGVAASLARFALDDMQARGVPVVPLCPFIAAYIKRHPEYEPLVDHRMTMDLQKRRR